MAKYKIINKSGRNLRKIEYQLQARLSALRVMGN